MAKRKIVWSSKAKFDLLKILEYFISAMDQRLIV
jgi:hypothetical protein